MTRDRDPANAHRGVDTCSSNEKNSGPPLGLGFRGLGFRGLGFRGLGV